MSDSIIHVGVGEHINLDEVAHIEIVGASSTYTSYIVKYRDSSRTNDEILLKSEIITSYNLAQMRKLACKIGIGTGVWRAHARKGQLMPRILGRDTSPIKQEVYSSEIAQEAPNPELSQPVKAQGVPTEVFMCLSQAMQALTQACALISAQGANYGSKGQTV